MPLVGETYKLTEVRKSNLRDEVNRKVIKLSFQVAEMMSFWGQMSIFWPKWFCKRKNFNLRFKVFRNTGKNKQTFNISNQNRMQRIKTNFKINKFSAKSMGKIIFLYGILYSFWFWFWFWFVWRETKIYFIVLLYVLRHIYTYRCLTCGVFFITYIKWPKQDKWFKNALQCRKHMCKWYVATRL